MDAVRTTAACLDKGVQRLPIYFQLVWQCILILASATKPGVKNTPCCMFASKADQRLVGFVDLGSANRDRERLIADDTADSMGMFVFMAGAVFKSITSCSNFSLPKLESVR